MGKTIKSLIINNGNYISQEKVELWGFDTILKCNYNQVNTFLSKNPGEQNEFYVILDEAKDEICSLISKVNFEEKASENDFLEGGTAGSLTIVCEDGTTLIKEFGAYMQEDIINLYEYIKKSLNSDSKLDIEWIFTKLTIYYAVATAKENEKITFTKCFDILKYELGVSENNDTLFNKLPIEHPVSQLYNAFDGMSKNTYQEIIKSIMLKIKYYDKVCGSTRLMTFISDDEVDEFAYEILYLNKGTDELKTEISSNIFAMNELGERYSYAGMHDEAYKLFKAAADKGHKIAMYNKIWCMYYGKGTEQNYHQAFVELNELVEKIGFPHATLLLGQMYYQGHGVDKDYNLAFKCFKDIEEFNAEAKYYLGEIYLNGYGIIKDQGIRQDYMKKSAKERCKKAIDYIIDGTQTNADNNINNNFSEEELREIFYHPMNEKELEEIYKLEMNDIIPQIVSSSFQIKYIENIGYVFIGERYLILDDGTEPVQYSVKIFISREDAKKEIINIYNQKK